MKMTYSHGSMQGASNVVILLQPRAAAQDLRQPKLPDSTLHVSDLALGRGRGLDPLGRLAANTTDHVGMCKGLGRPLLVLGIESRGNWLGNSRMKRRCPAGDYQIIVALVAGRRAGIAIARPRTGEGGVCGQRGGHVRCVRPTVGIRIRRVVGSFESLLLGAVVQLMGQLSKVSLYQ